MKCLFDSPPIRCPQDKGMEVKIYSSLKGRVQDHLTSLYKTIQGPKGRGSLNGCQTNIKQMSPTWQGLDNNSWLVLFCVKPTSKRRV
jgi:hypothetical protein